MKTRSLVLTCVFCLAFVPVGCDELMNSEEEEPNRTPSVPFDPIPSNGEMFEEAPTTISWNCTDPDEDPMVYDIFFGDTPNPPQVETDYPTNVWGLPGDITPGTWYWRIVVRDDSDEQAEGPLWQFTIVAPNQPPHQPYNPNPPSGTINWSFGGDLTWQCEDPDGDQLYYEFYFGETENPPLYTSTYDTFVHFGAIFDPLTTYSWKVVARDEQQAETAGPIWSFTTHGPSFPYNPYPADDAVDVELDVVLTWYIDNPEEAPLEYDVYLSTSDPPTLLAQNVTEMTFDPGGLHYDAPYTWKIVARKVDGGTTTARIVRGEVKAQKVEARTPRSRKEKIVEEVSSPRQQKVAVTQDPPQFTPEWEGDEDVEGPIWSFRTFDPTSLPPYEPSNPFPQDNTAGINPDSGSLSWTGGSPDPSAYLKYDIYLGTDSSNPEVLALTIVDTTIGYYGLLEETWYYWKVRSYDLDGDEAWSPTWSFHTGLTHLSTPEVPYDPIPTDGQGSVPLNNVTLQWTCADPDPDGDKVYWDIYISDTGSSSDQELLVSNLTTPSYTIPYELDPDTYYFWKVFAKDGYGHTINTSWWGFETTFAPFEITFPDANLEAVVREVTGITSGPIMTSDVDTLTEFYANSRGIADLTGLEYFINLETLSIDSNSVTDIGPVESCSHLVDFSASYNGFWSVYAVIGFNTTVQKLDLAGNTITELTIIQYCENLERLVLSENSDLSDLTYLQDLPALNEVYLVNTNVSDLTPLVNNADFATGDYLNVTGCPLSEDAINTQIPTLQARGVYVDY